MKAKKAKEIIEEIKKKYGIRFTDYKEEEKGGKITFIYYTIIFKIDE